MSSDPNSLEILARVATEVEAAALQGALAEHAIDAVITGGFTAGFKAEAPGDVAVLVREADLADARAVLTELSDDRDEIDWSKVDVGEPE